MAVSPTFPAACTPDTINAKYPCLKCYNNKELWIAIAWLLCQIAGNRTTCSADELADDSACFNCYNSERELLVAAVSELADFAYDNGYVTADEVANVVETAACHNCLDELTLKKYSLAQLCAALNTISTALQSPT